MVGNNCVCRPRLVKSERYSSTCSLRGLPGCKALLLPCAEPVLDGFEDLLLVGRRLLPVKVITGGSAAAGGTCTRSTRGRFAGCIRRLYCMLNGCDRGRSLFPAW